MKHLSVRLIVLVGWLLTYGIAVADEPPVARVFLLAGQSNMEGQGVVDLDHPQYYNGGRGTLQHVMVHSKHPGLYSHIKDDDGQWVVRDDVFVRFQTQHELKRGGLSIGFAGYPGKHHIGPEFQFGHVTGDAIKEPVLIIKTAWGGKSLYKDFRPPSAGGETGPFYRQMIEETREALAHAAEDFPELAGHRLQLSGFVWMQGWNDMVDQAARAEYEANLVHLIHDIRAEFELPQLPVVIGELGNEGPGAGEAIQQIRNAQKAATGREEFAGTVAFARTAPFARPAQESPNTGHGHHWYGNAESYFLVGDALGREMLVLLGLRPHADQNFVRWDADANGRLTRDELPEGIRGNFDRVDSDGDGFISVQEHLEVGRRGAAQSESAAKRGQRLPDNVELRSDIPYAGSENPRQTLDLLLPGGRDEVATPLPMVVFIHGGGWRQGSKSAGIGRMAMFAASGRFAAATIGYRLSDEAQWPAQIHDCKAAIRWLKANARQLNIDPQRIAVFGSSAGGHLVAMLGVSWTDAELEGTLGEHLDQNSRVAAVVDFFGPTNFLTMNDFPGRIDHNAADSPESQLLGGPIPQHPDRVRNASPLTWVTPDDAPALILHGTQDDLVPYQQSVDFHAALKKAGVDATLVAVQGAGHGFGGRDVDARVETFLQKHLLGMDVQVSSAPIKP